MVLTMDARCAPMRRMLAENKNNGNTLVVTVMPMISAQSRGARATKLARLVPPISAACSVSAIAPAVLA